MATTIMATFKIPLHQIYHQIHLKKNPPISQLENRKGTNMFVGDSIVAGLREAKL